MKKCVWNAGDPVTIYHFPFQPIVLPVLLRNEPNLSFAVSLSVMKKDIIFLFCRFSYHKLLLNYRKNKFYRWLVRNDHKRFLKEADIGMLPSSSKRVTAGNQCKSSSSIPSLLDKTPNPTDHEGSFPNTKELHFLFVLFKLFQILTHSSQEKVMRCKFFLGYISLQLIH